MVVDYGNRCNMLVNHTEVNAMLEFFGSNKKWHEEGKKVKKKFNVSFVTFSPKMLNKM